MKRKLNGIRQITGSHACLPLLSTDLARTYDECRITAVIKCNFLFIQLIIQVAPVDEEMPESLAVVRSARPDSHPDVDKQDSGPKLIDCIKGKSLMYEENAGCGKRVDGCYGAARLWLTTAGLDVQA